MKTSTAVSPYDFDAGEAVEVTDPSVPPHTMNVQYVQRESHETCTLCNSIMPDDIATAIEQGWYPDFWDGETHCDGPVCGECQQKYMTLEQGSGEFVLKELKGEYVSVWEAGDSTEAPAPSTSAPAPSKSWKATKRTTAANWIGSMFCSTARSTRLPTPATVATTPPPNKLGCSSGSETHV